MILPKFNQQDFIKKRSIPLMEFETKVKDSERNEKENGQQSVICNIQRNMFK